MTADWLGCRAGWDTCDKHFADELQWCTHCRAKKMIDTLERALRMVEWTPDLYIQSPVCYWCGGYKRTPAMDQDYYGKAGHKPDCPRQAALGEQEPPGK